MADAMVTGRMSAQKKNAGTQVLGKLGITASQAINQLYDYLIAHGQLPFSQKKKRVTKKDMQQARLFIEGMQRPNRFSDMPMEDIKRHKAAAMGYTFAGRE